jgi:hypothetical protein
MTVPLIYPFPLLYVFIKEHSESDAKCDELCEVIPGLGIYQIAESIVESRAHPSFLDENLQSNYCGTNKAQNDDQWVTEDEILLQ